MPTQTHKQHRMTAGERREQLLDVTKRLAVEHGFHDVSIEAVAREAGISRPIVYGHFGDLDGLVDALIQREAERALTQLSPALPPDLTEGDPLELLLAGLRGYLEAVQADPETWRLILMPPEGAPARMRERIAEGRTAVVAQLAQSFRPGFGPGREFPDPELAARMLSSLSDEFARLLLTEPERYPVERIMVTATWTLSHLAGRSMP
jgi:AcrR family transcriptional regulator